MQKTKVHDADFVLKEKIESDRAKAKGIRLKAKENYRRPERESLLLQITVKKQLKREEIDMRKQQQEFEKKQMEVSYQQQMRIQR